MRAVYKFYTTSNVICKLIYTQNLLMINSDFNCIYQKAGSMSFVIKIYFTFKLKTQHKIGGTVSVAFVKTFRKYFRVKLLNVMQFQIIIYNLHFTTSTIIIDVR